MQKFRVTLDITANVIETVSLTEIKAYMINFMEATDEDGIEYFEIGTVDWVEVEEI